VFGEGVTDPQQIHRAASSLRRAIAPSPDDFEHPDHEDLIAFAENGLGDADRELVETHIASCARCAEDVRDIVEIRAEMAAPAPGSRRTWKYAVGTVAGIAAVVAIAVLLRSPIWRTPNKEASASPAPPRESVPSASPREMAISREEQAAVDAAIAASRVDVPSDVRALAGSVGQLLGGDAVSRAMLPLSPSGTVVAGSLPSFSWQPIAGAVSYRVAVFDPAFRELASSGSLTTTSWTPTAQLPSGVPLAWQVTARMAKGSEVIAPAPPRPEARFTVLDAAAAAKVADLRSRLADQPIALGILLAKTGLLDDAAREFERASRQPALADLAAKLRASLRPPQ
jgi:hypothetical protein